ncbi:hypothetical protein BKA70DRAFT_1247992 [Coprinopsis sp. MPI-PUGE-AT-0042]|nr:hypothetical protein BKA70DRAFT_1247992 [Coprinopsis sp. MPI-PUGE-AT-0042]
MDDILASVRNRKCQDKELAELQSTLCQLARDEPSQAMLADMEGVSERLHGALRTLSGQDFDICRSLHAHSCILQSLALSSLGKTEQAIGILDHALIISTTPGDDHFTLIHNLVHSLQRDIASEPSHFIHDLPTAQSFKGNKPLPLTNQAIPKIDAPSMLAFQTRLYDKPFIVPGYAKDWPAMQEHPWRSASYLKSVAGPGRLVPVEIGAHYMHDSWRQQIMPWDSFLALMDMDDQPSVNPNSEKHYLAQHNIFRQFPALRDDIVVPDYAYATAFHRHLPDYKPPANEEGLIFNAWIGPERTISPAHTDPYNNLYVQLVGQKSVWIAPPTISVSMNIPSPEATLKNTARRDVFGEWDVDFKEQVAPHAMGAVLEPGDLLYTPCGWWHALRSESTSFSLSIWF